MGVRTKKKFTDSTFESMIETSEKKKLELKLSEIFEATQELITDGQTDPDKLHESLRVQFPNLEKNTFMKEVW